MGIYGEIDDGTCTPIDSCLKILKYSFQATAMQAKLKHARHGHEILSRPKLFRPLVHIYHDITDMIVFVTDLQRLGRRNS